MAAMESKSKGLTPRQHRAIGFLLSEATILEAARKAGVGERTSRRWLQEEEFLKAYQRARHECTRQTTALLQRAAGAAVQTLTALMTNVEISPSVRATAARAVLELGFHASELDLQEQLRQLEAKCNEIESQLLRRNAAFHPEGLSLSR